MASGELQYDQMIEAALRGVVRQALRTVVRTGLPGNHHFFITFKTGAPGVELSDYLRDKYPDEMTIVLQYQFWGLDVDTDKFGVTLSFNDTPERLVIPFAAVTAFADPAAKFGLQFQHENEAEVDAEEEPAMPRPAPGRGPAAVAQPVEPPPEKAEDAPESPKVVALDSFRRK